MSLTEERLDLSGHDDAACRRADMRALVSCAVLVSVVVVLWWICAGRVARAGEPCPAAGETPAACETAPQ